MTPSARIAVLAGLLAAPALAAPQPAVVELFTAQGCSSCPPANANLARLAGRPDIIALSFGVTYWDQLGWKDTFASPAFTARQHAYRKAFGAPNVYTPQVVVNGRRAIVGARRGEIEAAVRATPRPAGPNITYAHGQVVIGAGPTPARPADVWLVRYDPRTLNVPVRRGENFGRTLPHKNVVREFVRIGGWDGRPVRLSAPRKAGLAHAVIVQTAGAGPILAAAKG